MIEYMTHMRAGVTLPMTGAGTGCIAAMLLGLPQLRAFGAVVVGLGIAGILVSIVTVGIRGLFG